MRRSIKKTVKQILLNLNLAPLSQVKEAQLEVTKLKRKLTTAKVKVAKLEKELSIAEQRAGQVMNLGKSLNFNFYAAHGEYISKSIVPLATREKLGLSNNDFILKKYSNRFKSFKNFTKDMRFFLELDCLSRINFTMRKSGNYKHFPILFDFDLEEFKIYMSNNGVSLQELNTEVVIMNVDSQINSIIDTLEAAHVFHLDMSMTKNNITVDSDGILSVIDFDMAQVENRPFNWTVSEKMNSEKYRLTKDRLYEVIFSTEQLRIIK